MDFYLSREEQASLPADVGFGWYCVCKDLTGCDDLGLVNGSGNDHLLKLGNLELAKAFFENIFSENNLLSLPT